MRGRTARYGINTVVMILLLLGIVATRGGRVLPAQRAARPHREPPQQPGPADHPAPARSEDGRERGGLLPERPAGQARGRGPLQAVRALRRRAFHLEGRRSRPRARAGPALQRGDVRHGGAGDQGQVGEGDGRRGGEAHQRPGAPDPRGQARRLRHPGPRRARADQHRARRLQRGQEGPGAGELRGQAARSSPARGRCPTTRPCVIDPGPAHGSAGARGRRPRRLSWPRRASSS